MSNERGKVLSFVRVELCVQFKDNSLAIPFIQYISQAKRVLSYLLFALSISVPFGLACFALLYILLVYCNKFFKEKRRKKKKQRHKIKSQFKYRMHSNKRQDLFLLVLSYQIFSKTEKMKKTIGLMNKGSTSQHSDKSKSDRTGSCQTEGYSS